MSNGTKKISAIRSGRGTTSVIRNSKQSKGSMESQRQKKQPRVLTIEEQYLQIFAPFPMPTRDLYTDADSLEQPSAQRYVPSTTMPTDWTPEQMRILGPCGCEYCQFARDDLKVRKFEIEGEDNSHIHDQPPINVEPGVTKIADFETWWSSTNNQNWFSNKPITLKDLKETACYAWNAAKLGGPSES